MAERKPMYMTSDAFHLEMSSGASDSLALGGLTLGGNLVLSATGATITELAAATEDGDVLSQGQSGANLAGVTLSGNLAMNSQKITGLADPTGPNDGATLDYVDAAAIAAGHFREALLDSDQLDTTHGIFAAVALILGSNATTGNLITLKDGTTTRIYGATSGGDVQYTIGVDRAASMQNLADAIDGDGSGAWSATFYADALDEIEAGGIIVIIEKSTATGVSKVWDNDQDNNQHVNFTGEADYTKKTLNGLPSSEPGSSNFGFRRTVANLVDGELHLMFVDHEVFSWDDSGNAWNQISGAGGITDATAASGGGTLGKVGVDSDLGLDVSSGILEVDLYSSGALAFDSSNKGIEVVPEASNPSLKISGNELGVKFASSGSSLEAGSAGLIVSIDTAGAIVRDGVNDGLELNLASSNPGLQINGSNELGVKFSSTLSGLEAVTTLGVNLEDSNPTVEEVGGSGMRVKINESGGMLTGASGLSIEIDDTPDTLDVDSDGLKAVGVPATFKIAGSAVAAGVTHTNLNTLTDGSSNCDSLHTHTAIEVDEAQRLENDINVAEDIPADRAVKITASNQVSLASSASGDLPIGVAVTAQDTIGQPTNVVSSGIAAGVLSGATPGTPYYVFGASGVLGNTLPPAGHRVVQVGVARTADDLFVDIIDYGKKAA